MSRGFDGLEIDYFQGPERGVNRSPESNSRAGWDTVRRLERIRGEEERADQRDQEARGTSGGNRPPLPREDRVQLVLARTSRTNYVDRNRTYQLRDSELHALTEVGQFRVVAIHGSLLHKPLAAQVREIVFHDWRRDAHPGRPEPQSRGLKRRWAS
jgi:hypothetical protein